jgi:NAD(P)-dependent dehydrogenase (short-subunit alcohol dehydrogenase family)
MTTRTWLIAGVSSGFGRELTEQLLRRGDRVVGTVRDTGKVSDLTTQHPDTFCAEVLEVTEELSDQQIDHASRRPRARWSRCPSARIRSCCRPCSPCRMCSTPATTAP